MNRSMMTVAFAVLDRLEPIAPDSWWLESYSNGREQGFNIWSGVNNRRVSFSRDRSSDDIVVYIGMYSDFQLAGNTPLPKHGEHNRYFFTNALDASNFIFNYLYEVQDATITTHP